MERDRSLLPAHVVDEEKNDIGFFRLALSGPLTKGENEKNEPYHFVLGIHIHPDFGISLIGSLCKGKLPGEMTGSAMD
jgi:hypothetical protein